MDMRGKTAQTDDLAADVVAETFPFAWRRVADVPLGPDGRLWLFGTARHVLANHQGLSQGSHQVGAAEPKDLYITNVNSRRQR